MRPAFLGVGAYTLSSTWHMCGGTMSFHGAGMPTASVDWVGCSASHVADAAPRVVVYLLAADNCPTPKTG